jgi:hypothetical protein
MKTVMRTLLPLITLSLLALGCQSQGPAPLGIEHGTPTDGAPVRVTARISGYAPNAIEDHYGDSRPPEFFDELTLTLLSPPPFVKRVLRVGITETQKQVWQRRRGIVKFTISGSDLSNALKPDSSYQLFDGALLVVEAPESP